MNGKFQCINEIVASLPHHRRVAPDSPIDLRTGKCLRGDNCRYSHAGIDPSSGFAIGDDNAVPEQLIREGAKVPEGARVLPSGGDTDRMAELFKQAGVTTIAEFNAKQKALGFGLPNERERKPPPKASQAEIDEVLPLLQPLPESYRQAILAIPGCLGHILCGNQPVRRVHPTTSRPWRGRAGSVERRGIAIAKPSSRRRVDGVEDDAVIERVVKF